MIQISVNNETQQISENTSLTDALAQWCFSNTKIAVAINNEFIPRSTYDAHRINAGDKIDIVKPVGGG